MHAVVTRSLDARGFRSENADVYVKLWSVRIAQPLPDKVYVKMTVYSIDHHRLVECIYPGGSSSVTEASLEYKSVTWERTNISVEPVFGDLVRLSISPELMRNGYVQLSVMTMNEARQPDGETVLDELGAFTVELPLISPKNPEIWIEDGEHTLYSTSSEDCVTVRCMTITPFGYKNANIARILGQPSESLEVDRILLLRYIPIDELQRHLEELTQRLLDVMASRPAEQQLQNAIVDVLAVLATVQTEGDWEIDDQDREATTTGVLLCSGIRLGLEDSSRRNPIIKGLTGLLKLVTVLAPSQDKPIQSVLADIMSPLLSIAGDQQDQIARLLVIKHWPHAVFRESNHAIAFLDRFRASSISERKAKLRFILSALDENICSPELVPTLWRHLQPMLCDRDVSQISELQLSVAVSGRLVDVMISQRDAYADVLEFLGMEALRVHLEAYMNLFSSIELKLQEDISPHLGELLTSWTGQPGSLRRAVLLAQLQAIIVSLTLSLYDRIDPLLEEYVGTYRSDFASILWKFLALISQYWQSQTTMATYANLEATAWLELLVMGNSAQRILSPSTNPSFTTIVQIIRKCYSLSMDVTVFPRVNQLVQSLESGISYPDAFESIGSLLELAIVSVNPAIRQACHRCFVKLSNGKESTVNYDNSSGTSRLADVPDLCHQLQTALLLEAIIRIVSHEYSPDISLHKF